MRFLLQRVVAGFAATLLSAIVTMAPIIPLAFPPPTTIKLSVVDKSSLGGQIGAQVFAKCLIRSDGGTCTITKGKSVSRAVQVTFGMTWNVATAQLGIGNETRVTTTVSCSSPAMAAGTAWKARSIGTKYYYAIRRQTIQAGHVLATKTSSRLTAFNPSRSSIACGLL